ncbi:transcription termination/antitermination protein NusA [bacterium]|nr:transcription termination/antitermination protein NusA [bacterium]
MNLQLIEAMRQIERARKVDRAILIEAIEAALVSASRKSYGAAQDIRVVFNSETGELTALVKYAVVDEVKESWHEVNSEEAHRSNPKANVGDTIEKSISPSDFGRIAAQTAKQVMIQRVRESERNAIYEEFKKRQGEMVNGIVLRMEQRNIIIDLGDTEAILPVREQVARETYQNGDRVKTYILEVRRTSRSPQVVVSRTHPGLVRRLFEMEVPEVADGVVQIMTVAREAGARSKVAVISKDDNVDPVGACVGVKGSRIQTIVREIRGEKIDVITFSENMEALLTAALQPAKIVQMTISDKGKQAIVVVKDDQLALAIGKGGQNVRLASKLTGLKIDIVGDTQNRETMRKKAEAAFLQTVPALEEISGIGQKMAERLKSAGYMSVVDLQNVDVKQLQEVPGIGPKTAEKILEILENYLPRDTKPEVERTAAELFAGLSDETKEKTSQKKELKVGDLFAGLDKKQAEEMPPPDKISEQETGLKNDASAAGEQAESSGAKEQEEGEKA